MTTFAELPEEILSYLLNHPYDGKNVLKNVNLEDSIETPINIEGWTLLHYFVFFENIEAVEILLKAGANPNLKDACGRTPLFRVTGYSAGAMARLLIQHNADIEAICPQGEKLGVTFLDTRLSFDNKVSAVENVHLVSIDQIEKFEFSDKLKNLTILSYNQGQIIANVNSLFSVIAEAIYLKGCNKEGSFHVTDDIVEKLKKYSNDSRANELSKRFWQNLLEYGKRVHEGYKEQLEVDKKGPSEDEIALANLLLEKQFNSAIHDAAMLLPALQPEDAKHIQENASQAAAKCLSLAAAILEKDASHLSEVSNIAGGSRGAVLFKHLSAETTKLASTIQGRANAFTENNEDGKRASVKSKTRKVKDNISAKTGK